MSSNKKMLTRRRVLVSAGSTLIAFVTAAVLRRSYDSDRPPVEHTGEAARIESTHATVAEFAGALFGRELSDEDRDDLRARLRDAVSVMPENAVDYTALAYQADQLARHVGAADFRTANADQREAIVGRIMSLEVRSPWPRLFAHLSSRQARESRTRAWTIPNLANLYRSSAVPWRARGYRRWPGIPGDWQDILTAGPPAPS
jgi:hypothetical protein